jgi:DNA-binding NarL/FixJ family response regulator
VKWILIYLFVFCLPVEVRAMPSTKNCAERLSSSTGSPLVILMLGKDRFVQEGIRLTIGKGTRSHVCHAPAFDGSDFSEIASLQPDIIIWDISGEKSAEIITNLADLELQHPATKVLTIIEKSDPFLVRQLLATGVMGIIDKTEGSLSEVEEAIMQVTSGTIPRRFISSSLVTSALNEEAPVILTEQERKVVSLTIQGLSAKRIATAIGIKTRTVNFHLTNARAKLAARNKAQLVLNATRAGIQ